MPEGDEIIIKTSRRINQPSIYFLYLSFDNPYGHYDHCSCLSVEDSFQDRKYIY
jgi:hypothetical protein